MAMIKCWFVVTVTLLSLFQVVENLVVENCGTKIGCFAVNEGGWKMVFQDKIKDAEFFSGTVIDWNDFHEYLDNESEGLSFRCATAASKAGSKYYSLRDFAQCWIYVAKMELNFQTMKKSRDCVKHNYLECDHDKQNGHCVSATELTQFVYESNIVHQAEKASVNGGYTEWSAWTTCSMSCGRGIKERERTCTKPVPSGENGQDCTVLGDGTSIAECNLGVCKDGPVSTSGGNAGGANCVFPFKYHGKIYHSCKAFNGDHWCSTTADYHKEKKWGFCDRVDGGFGKWQEATACSVTCGTGVKRMARKCNSPQPRKSGKKCEGRSVKTVDCLKKACPKTMTEGGTGKGQACVFPFKYQNKLYYKCAPWVKGNWCSTTSVYAGKWGFCKDNLKSYGGNAGGADCIFPFEYWGVKHEKCLKYKHGEGYWCATTDSYSKDRKWGMCPKVDGGFGEWEKSGSCSVTCGNGKQKMTRKCNDPPPYKGGKDCVGENEKTEDCQMDECPVAGGFSAWADEAACTKTCGGGTKKMVRTCNNPTPSHSGKDCQGERSKLEACATEKCPDEKVYTKGGNSNGAACVFPFTYAGKTYHNCPAYNGGIWCSITSTYANRWGYCKNQRGAVQKPTTSSETIYTTGGSGNGAACVFPFTYLGKVYHICPAFNGGVWCSTTATYVGKWGYCKKQRAVAVQKPATTPKPIQSDKIFTYGANANGVACVFPFTYQSRVYNSCPPWLGKIWCSITSVYAGKWGYCKKQRGVSPYKPTTGGNGSGAECLFPFVYGGKTYNTCAPWNGRTWCATQVNAHRVYANRWGYC